MLLRTLLASFTLICLCSPAFAHFGMVIPSDNVATGESRSVDITLSFAHPFEGAGMELVTPEAFYVMRDGKTKDLLSTLKKTEKMGHTSWRTMYTFARPGVYQLVMEPKPYWEPEEDCFIIHYTKAFVAAFGSEDGWDAPAGLKTEIIPLTRPFGNYAGNTFTGQVVLDGKPVSGAEVEVEFYNEERTFTAPTPYHVTQVVKADAQGVFSFTCPQAGWWGFAALNTADYQLKAPDGTMKDVELGAVLWIKMDSWKK